jgi:hypothetical protein
MVLGIRWSFEFKTLLYPKLDCFLFITVGFFTSPIFLYSGIKKGELKEMDEMVSWASAPMYYPLQIES